MAAETLKMLSERPEIALIELGYAVDDAEAQSMGWPCASAQWACLRLVIAESNREFSCVPRGTTMATAAAADVREK